MRGVAGLVVAVLALGVLAGCSSTSDEVSQYAKQAAAAEQSAAVGSQLFRQGKALEPETSTLFDDAMKQLASAHDSLSQLQASGQGASSQHRALDSVRGAIDALLKAQRELDRGAVSSATSSELRHAAEALRKEVRPA